MRSSIQVNLAFLPVATLWLKEHHWVVRFDGLLNHPIGIVGIARADHAQTCGVSKIGFWAFAVVFNRTDSATKRHADNDWHLNEAFRAVGHFGQLGGDLVEGRKNEAVELNLNYRAVAAHGQTNSGSNDAGFGNR